MCRCQFTPLHVCYIIEETLYVFHPLTFPVLTLSEMSACGVFDAFDDLVDPCGVRLDSDELLLIISNGLNLGNDVGGGYDSDAFCYAQRFGDVVNEFELFVVLDRLLGWPWQRNISIAD